MARITVEDCLEKIDSQYDLVLLAKERTSQLNAGDPALVPLDNDKNTVISLREIGEGKVSIKTLEDAGINKLRKKHEVEVEHDEQTDDSEDNFDKIYKGEISKSGAAILPSKRVRRIPEKMRTEASITEEELNKNTEEDLNKKTEEELTKKLQEELTNKPEDEEEAEVTDNLSTETKSE